jgi:UDP-N-acetylmuramoyl-L-alanyl-D-glutamate--2,6-diaminopimelate ligase
VRTIGVTGTNGKTTTTTLIAAALARVSRPVARITTLGFFLDDERIDLPASHDGSLQLARRAASLGGQFAAVEYTSEALARGYATLWPAEVGVFTNLTHDHLDAHKSPEHYLASKAQLFMHLPHNGVAVLNACDPASQLIAEVIPEGVRVLTYGLPSRGEAVMPIGESGAVSIDWHGTTVGRVRTRAIGEVFAENALAAFVAATAMGVPVDAAIAAIAEAAPPAGRFEVVAERPWAVVDYAHTPDALARTLRTARALAARVLVVFGAGGNRDRDKRAPMGVAASIADRIYLTTDNPRDEDPAAIARDVRAGITTDVVEEPDRATAIRRAIEDAGPGDVVVIAGKGHERTQTIAGVTRAFDDAAIVREIRDRSA